jgi:hypothetical protein
MCVERGTRLDYGTPPLQSHSVNSAAFPGSSGRPLSDPSLKIANLGNNFPRHT